MKGVPANSLCMSLYGEVHCDLIVQRILAATFHASVVCLDLKLVPVADSGRKERSSPDPDYSPFNRKLQGKRVETTSCVVQVLRHVLTLPPVRKTDAPVNKMHT